MTFATFTPVSALVGGALIGLSASMLLRLNGQVAGISGVVDGLLRSPTTQASWRSAFVLGLLVGGGILLAVRPESFGPGVAPPALTVVAGLLVGFGTRVGGGCTSGHGVCGIARFSKRSIVATLTFMATGALAVFVVRHVLHVGGPGASL